MKNRDLLIVFALLALLLPGCAAKETVVAVIPDGGEKVIRIEASSYAFVPTIIQAHRGDRLLLRVVNVAGVDHNLTLKNQRGELVTSVDLAPEESIEIPVELTEEGTWQYYCNKPFHKTFGMRGRIEAAPFQ